MTRIDVVTDHSGSGFIVAVDTSDRPPGAGYDWSATATAVTVGQVHHSALPRDTWTAWLWKQAGCYPPTGMHSDAVKKPTVTELAVALRKRLDKDGAWWTP